MSAESAKRICEVLNEVPMLDNPENPVMSVKDGSVEFTDVSFKYSEKAERFALSDISAVLAYISKSEFVRLCSEYNTFSVSISDSLRSATIISRSFGNSS